MTLLEIIQEVSDDAGITAPDTVIGNPDLQITQLLRLANKEGRSLARRPWDILKVEFTHITVASELQGLIKAIIPGYKSLVSETLWNRTQNHYIFGPIAIREWQAKKSSGITGPFSEFRIRGGNLIFIPAPTAGETVAGEVRTDYFCESSGGDAQSSWLADNDVARLDDELMILGILWRWKRAKGFDYAEEFEDYQRDVLDALGVDGGNRVLNMGEESDHSPGVGVQDGDFTL